MEIPRWIVQEEECLFCWKYYPVSEIHIDEEDESLQVIYECKNDKCDCYRRLGYRAQFKMRYEGKGFIEQYKKGIEKAWKPDVEAQA